jgi:hypothetical protein
MSAVQPCRLQHESFNHRQRYEANSSFSVVFGSHHQQASWAEWMTAMSRHRPGEGDDAARPTPPTNDSGREPGQGGCIISATSAHTITTG